MRSPCSSFYSQLACVNVGLASSLPCTVLHRSLSDHIRPSTNASSSRKSKSEHGSVLTELMSVKEDEQPKQLTVGAKGVWRIWHK